MSSCEWQRMLQKLSLCSHIQVSALYLWIEESTQEHLLSVESWKVKSGSVCEILREQSGDREHLLSKGLQLVNAWYIEPGTRLRSIGRQVWDDGISCILFFPLIWVGNPKETWLLVWTIPRERINVNKKGGCGRTSSWPGGRWAMEGC